MDWQIESGVRTSVFLSSTSSDLGNYRRRVSEILQQGGIFPVVQDYFGSDYRTIEDMLLDKILASDAVICIIGHVFGAFPNSDNSTPERSYTQIEFDLSVRYDKHVYLFVADEKLVVNNKIDEPKEFQLKQKKHRENILGGSRKYQIFSSMAELEQLIRDLIIQILGHAGQRSINFVDNPPEPLCFVGRNEEIEQLNSAIDKRIPSVIVLLGMGGQGKTTVVAHTLRKIRKSLPFSAGIWISAERSNMTFSEFLDCALMEFMGNRFNKLDFPRLDSRLRQLIIIMQKKPILIVIDAIERWLTGWGENTKLSGFHDLSLRKGNCSELDDFLQQVSALNNGSHVIITSRALPAALDLVLCTIVPVFPQGNNEIGLNGLTDVEAIKLLKSLGMIGSNEKLKNLAKSLVCHPLALTGFARVANKLGKDWASLLFEKDNDPSRVFHNLIDEIRKHLPNREISEFVLTCASHILEGASIELLKILIEKNSRILNKNREELNILVLVLTLAEWNLLIWDNDLKIVRLHSLVAEYFSKLISDNQKKEIHNSIALWYNTESVENSALGSNNRILALNHLLLAEEGKKAFDCMFDRGYDNVNTFDWLISQGHMWECAEFLHNISGKVSDIEKVHCILARTQILNELELSHLALLDLQLATAIILMSQNSNWPPIQILLAKCYGFLGIVHNETGKASTAISFLNKSIKIFDSLDVLNDENIIDLIITLSNRGLAKNSTGEWNEAISDYKRIINIYNSSEFVQKEKLDISILIDEIRFRIANIKLDSGEIILAIHKMESIIEKISQEQVKSIKRPGKNYFLSLVAFASANILNNNPLKALAIIDELIAQVGEFIAQGSWEYKGVLAQAFVNRARAMIHLSKNFDALLAANRAVSSYEEIIKKDAKQLEGQLANALFIRAEVNFLSGNDENISYIIP